MLTTPQPLLLRTGLGTWLVHSCFNSRGSMSPNKLASRTYQLIHGVHNGNSQIATAVVTPRYQEASWPPFSGRIHHQLPDVSPEARSIIGFQLRQGNLASFRVEDNGEKAKQLIC